MPGERYGRFMATLSIFKGGAHTFMLWVRLCGAAQRCTVSQNATTWVRKSGIADLNSNNDVVCR